MTSARCISLFVTVLLCSTGVASQTDKQVAVGVKREVVQQMVSDGQISGECVQEQGLEQLVKEIEIYQIRLTRRAQPAYKIMGRGCAGGGYGAGNRGLWIYHRTSNGLALIFGEEGGVDVSPLKRYTNNYADLELVQLSGGGGGSTYFAFDGKRYRER